MIGLLLAAELGCRSYSYLTGGPVAALARQSPVAGFVFVSDDPWQFDRTQGFVGRPGLRYLIGSATGLDVGCSELPASLWPGGDLGPSWDSAELRIALFGVDDAVQQPDWNRRPWPRILAEELSRRLGRRVEVASYSRPQVGPLQALVLAADRAPAIKSHLVVLAPSTGTLSLDFTYRSVGRIEGASVPVASHSPQVNEAPEVGAPVGAIVNPRVTKAWCDEMQSARRGGVPGLLRFDSVLAELQNQANVASLLAGRSLVSDWLSPRPALLPLLHLQAPRFVRVKEVARLLPRYLSNPDLGRDRRATTAMTTLRSAGIPVVVLHSPVLPELLERKVLLKYAGVPQSYLDALVASLEGLTGHRLLRMTDVLDRDVTAEASRIVNSPQGDWQLRVAGTELYGRLAAHALAPVVATIERPR